MWNPTDMFLGVAGVAIIAATAWRTAAPPQDPADTALRADRVHLSHGKGAARIDIDEQGHVTFVLSKEDGGSATVRLAPNPTFEIRQRAGDSLKMSIQRDTAAAVQVGNLRHEVRLSAGPKWTGFGAKTDKAIIFGLGYSTQSDKHFYMCDRKGQLVLSMSCTKAGGGVVLSDSKARTAMYLGAADGGHAIAGLTDPTGQDVVVIKSDKAGDRLDLGGPAWGAHQRWRWTPEGQLRHSPIEGVHK